MGEITRKPVRRLPRNKSQIKMTGNAKNDRKNTASPGGMSAEVALISADMMMNIATEMSLYNMPRADAIGVSL